MDRFDTGTPGTSMSDAGVALVPRAIWKDKPDVSRFGLELDALFYNRLTRASFLAPTYTGEAYWNGGWFYLILISILVGLEIGWFTHKWNRFLSEGFAHVGILIFSPAVAFFSVWVETWVVLSYVGRFVTLVILIKIVDFLVPPLTGFLAGRDADGSGAEQ
jgi:hypothetical protein